MRGRVRFETKSENVGGILQLSHRFDDTRSFTIKNYKKKYLEDSSILNRYSLNNPFQRKTLYDS